VVKSLKYDSQGKFVIVLILGIMFLQDGGIEGVHNYVYMYFLHLNINNIFVYNILDI